MKSIFKASIISFFVISSVSSALAATFTNSNTEEATLVFNNKPEMVSINIQQNANVYAGEQLDALTEVATVTADYTASSTLGIRWANTPYQTVNNMLVTVENETDDSKQLSLMFGSHSLTQQVDDDGEAYYVSNQPGQLNTSIIIPSRQTIAAGAYKLAVESAVYNP